MARRRMISPDIWASDDFSKLSDFARLVFIGLFSQADDEGFGKAKPVYIKSILFPNDEKKRTTDIEFALSEIARSMSIDFYEVEGNSYYRLRNWSKWQSINKPTKSKIPKPQNGVAKVFDSKNEKLVNDYGSTTVALQEDYVPKEEIEEEKEEEIEISSSLLTLIPNLIIDCEIDKEYNMELLAKAVKESDYLKDFTKLSGLLKKYDEAINGKYKNFDKPKRFTKPALEEVKAYCVERKNNIDAEQFIDFYESKGWRIGKEAMKDWKAAVRTWEKRNNGNENKQGKIEVERHYSQEELNNIFDNIDDLN